MNPLAAARFLVNVVPTQANLNTGQGASDEGVDYTKWHVFTAAQTYNGEAFSAGDILIGDNAIGEENLAYKGGAWLVRVGNTNYITFGATGIRVVNGGLTLSQHTETVTNGNIEFSENNEFITSSHLYITASTGAFIIDSIAEPLNPGHVLILINSTANNMTLTNDYATPSTGYWAIHTYTGGAVATTGDGIAMLIGNETAGRWDLIHLQG